jgi:hypothetical protein
MMRVLNQLEFYMEAEPILRKIFTDTGLYHEPFSPLIQHRRIIYDYHYVIEAPLIEAIVFAAKEVNDNELYLSVLYPPIIDRQLIDNMVSKLQEFNPNSTTEQLEVSYNPSLQKLLNQFQIASASREYSYPLHWKMSVKEFEEAYIAENTQEVVDSAFMMSHAIYSPNGSWGISVSEEHFGLLGGTKEFMDKVSEKFPSIKMQAYQFIRAFEIEKSENPNRDFLWLPALVSHVYGVQTAELMLANTIFLK